MTVAISMKALTLLSVAVLGGCAGPGGTRGVVQSGPASVLAIVDQTDKRAEAAGIAGVKIRAESRPPNGPPRIIADVTSDASGKFVLPIKDNAALKEQVWVIAEKEGFQPLKTPIYMPGEGRVLIVVLNKSGK